MGGPNRSDHPIAIAIAGRNSSGPMSAGTPAYSQYHTPRSAGAMTPNSIYVSPLLATPTRICCYCAGDADNTPSFDSATLRGAQVLIPSLIFSLTEVVS